MLSNSDALGNRVQLISSPEQIREFLNTTAVNFIVLDMNGFLDPVSRAHHRLLEETIRRHPNRFRLIGVFPLNFDGRRRAEAVQVYENLTARANQRDHPHQDGEFARESAEHSPEDWKQGSFNATDAIGVANWLLGLRPPENTIATSFRIAPGNERIAADGGWSRVYVTALPEQSWEARGLPSWMTMISNGSGRGDGILNYRVAANETSEGRWAVISVGDGFFQVTQPSFPYIDLPFVETFRGTGPSPDGYSFLPKPSRWHLMDSPGGRSKLAVATEGPTVPTP